MFCVQTVRILAQRSRALRAKVGCIIWDTKKRSIISLGYNGTPPGEDNTMEQNNVTLPTVIHAEMNALKKLSWGFRNHHVLLVTHLPCALCAEHIVASGIRRVYYLDMYGTTEGLRILRHHHIHVTRIIPR